MTPCDLLKLANQLAELEKLSHMTDLLIRNTPPGTIGVATVTGWTDSSVFMEADSSVDKRYVLAN